MDHFETVFLISLGIIILLGFGAFGIISYFEREQRATRIAFSLAIVGSAIFGGIVFTPQPVPGIATWGAILLGVGFVILFVLPIGRIAVGNDTPDLRMDEREVIFSRRLLQSGSPEYKAYYARHPEHEAEDNKTRARPGLLSPQAKYANPFLFAVMQGSNFMSESLWNALDGPISETKQFLSPEKMTSYIFNLARFYGAVDVGVTELRPYHVYSHIGRGTGTYGEPIPVVHKYAIAFTVEMDFTYIGTSPYPPAGIETLKQYVELDRVAVQLAAAIRALGYPARAHIEGNYQVIAPLVARDAGLGEIGRIAVLMTPRLGPRVRLGVVTTDLELVPVSRRPNQAVIDFCTICKKCARVCPSRSLPLGPRQEINGTLRWKLNPDTCFRFWNVIGTDCSRCVVVCPFSHPNTWAHNLIRWGIARSGFFRRLALWMDDLFYGREPEQRPAPVWTKIP
jgi:ferredoxin